MYYADFKQLDTVNGQGIRQSLWVSGCTHYCKGCFNPQAWNFKYGKEFTKETEEMVLDSFRNAPVKLSGLSLLGGEPFENVEGLLPFLKRFKEEFPDMTIWCWTGFTFGDLLCTTDKKTREMLHMIDVLVDGKFIEEQKDLTLKFRGSKNQRVIDLKKSFALYRIILWEDRYE